MKEKLTQNQQKILDFILEYVQMEKVPPTVREIAGHFGFASPGTVQDYLGILKTKGFINVKKNFYRGIELLAPACGIPLVGRVRAGNPEEAIENVDEFIDVSRLFPRNNSTFALKVHGDSMAGSGIFEGDLAIVMKQRHAEDNDIVVALVDQQATVKRFKRKLNNVWLQPDNPDYEPIRGKEFSIMGRVVGIIRNY